MLPSFHTGPGGFAGVRGAGSERVLPSSAGGVSLSRTLRGFIFFYYFFFLRPDRCYFLQREKCFSIIGAGFGLGVKI